MTIERSTLDPPAGYDPPRARPGAQSLAPSKAKPLHIPSLDGLRAISFLIVFLSHAGVPGMPGGFGVTVFFFLSGYLITTLMRQEVEQRGAVDFKLFYLRRALRILPPFYLVLIAATIMTAIMHPGYLRVPAVLAQFLHYGNYWFAFNDWNGIGAGTGVYWSLAIEEHFYFVFPGLYMLLYRGDVRGSRMAQAFWALCAMTLAWRCYLVFVAHAPVHRIEVGSDSRLDSILFGCALAVWNNPAIDAKKRAPIWDHLLLGLSLLALLVSFAYRPDWFRETFRYTLQGLALGPIFVAAIRLHDRLPFRWLDTPILRRLGLLSYSLYLVHHTVLEVLTPRLPDSVLLRIAIGLTLSIGLAQAIYVLVEKPCAELRRRLSTQTAR